MNKTFFVLVLSFSLSSCQTVGVIESNNPRQKLADGYAMLQNKRSIPALRLFQEANEIAYQGSDDSLKAQTQTALGDAYKFKDAGSQTKITYSMSKAISSYKAATVLLQKLKYNHRLSMAYIGLYYAYIQEKDVKSGCENLNKAAKAYYDGSAGDDDMITQDFITPLKPVFVASKSQNFKMNCVDGK